MSYFSVLISYFFVAILLPFFIFVLCILLCLHLFLLLFVTTMVYAKMTFVVNNR